MPIGESGVNVDLLIHACFKEAQVVGHAIPLRYGATSGGEGERQMRFFDINGSRGKVIVFTADYSAEKSQLLETDESMCTPRKIYIGNSESKRVGRPLAVFIRIAHGRNDSDRLDRSDTGIDIKINVKSL